MATVATVDQRKSESDINSVTFRSLLTFPKIYSVLEEIGNLY